MGGVDDMGSSPHLGSSSASPALLDAWGVWSRDGAPALNGLLTALFEDRAIRDPKLCTLVFDMVGLYLVRLGQHFNAETTIEEAHALCLSECMSRPAVGHLIEQAMSGVVNSKVSEVVE